MPLFLGDKAVSAHLGANTVSVYLGTTLVYTSDQAGQVATARPQRNRLVADLSDPDGRITSVENVTVTYNGGSLPAGVTTRLQRRNNFPDEFRSILRGINFPAGTYVWTFTYTDPIGSGRVASGTLTI